MAFRKAGSGETSVLTLNLHCFQEDQPYEKLALVVEAILQLEPDLVLLQECAQDRWAPERVRVTPGVSIREGNAALWLVERLRAEGLPYHGVWDWAHYGWERWEEGCAVLSRHPIRYADSHYVSRSTGPGAWKSRKPVAALVDVAGFGPVMAFSTHLGWWADPEEPFEDALDRLVTWQEEFQQVLPMAKRSTRGAPVPLVTAGDFNQPAGGEGYEFLLDWTGWQDSWLVAHPDGMAVPTIGPNTDGWEGSSEAHRIDYLFTRPGDNLKVVACERIFTDEDFGRVSDHVGVWALLGR